MRVSLFPVLGSVLFASTAWAGLTAGNDRPLSTLPAVSSDIYTPADPAYQPASAQLQDILNYIYGCDGCVDANTDQQSASMWKSSTKPATLLPTLAVEFSTNPNIEFGLWSGSDISSLTLAPIFKTAATGVETTGDASTAILSWNSITGKLSISGDPGVVYSGTYNIPSSSFGFYIKTAAGDTWYSDDELNGGNPQMLAYLGGNSTTSAGAWTLAFEETAFGASDKDFNDFVVKIESMAAVPEPGAFVMLGTVIVGVGVLYRRRSSAQTAQV
jgi:hypothetical protein